LGKECWLSARPYGVSGVETAKGPHAGALVLPFAELTSLL
jgi:hypothetical protein